MNAQLVVSATGKYTTTCRLCRKEVAKAPALDLPIVGQPNKRMHDLMQVLTKHLGKHHASEFQQGAALLDETLSWLVLTAYDHEDPSVLPRMEAIRAQLFQRVQSIRFDNENISKLLEALNLQSPDEAQKVEAAMRALRDACCELGTFAPAT